VQAKAVTNFGKYFVTASISALLPPKRFSRQAGQIVSPAQIAHLQRRTPLLRNQNILKRDEGFPTWMCHRSETVRRTDMINVTTIIAMPPQNSTWCGRRMTDQIAAGGQETVASRRASMQASTPERNPVAVAILRFLSGVI
jgi:hypothetical protein